MNKDLFERGLAIRKAVLGKDYVEKSIAAADDFSRPMQELATEYCWGRLGPPGARAEGSEPDQSRDDQRAQPSA